MKKLFAIVVLLGATLGIHAQVVYSLQKCRELALQNNRQLQVSRMTVEVAENTRKAAKTKYMRSLVISTFHVRYHSSVTTRRILLVISEQILLGS